MSVGRAGQKCLFAVSTLRDGGPGKHQPSRITRVFPSHLARWCLVSLQHWLWGRILPKPSLFRGAGCRSNNSAHELFPWRKRNTQSGSSPSIFIQKKNKIPLLNRTPPLLWLWVSAQHCPSSCSPAAAWEVGAHFPVKRLSQCEMLHIAARPRALTRGLEEPPEISLVGRKNILCIPCLGFCFVLKENSRGQGGCPAHAAVRGEM